MESAEIPPENPSRIEPARLELVSEAVADRVAELSEKAGMLGAHFHPTTAANLARLVRVMNTHYSNLIEGHDTRPLEIEQALLGHFDANDARRNLQLEATAHVRLQAEIDRLAADGELPEPASLEFLRWLHREFYKDAPQEMLCIRSENVEFLMVAGQWRTRPEQDVSVGRHVPPSSGRVEAFMQYFANRYRFETMGPGGRIMAMAAAHHRFNYVHPFPDGNGRVSRLMSHAMALKAGIGAHGLWSVSRGLARGLESPTEYKRKMDHADTPRQGDLDGRGNLSYRALEEFTVWFLDVCLDQVVFMSALFDLENLAKRLRVAVEQHETLKPQAARLLHEALVRGEFDRGEASRIAQVPDRSARRLLGQVIEAGLLGSETPKGPVSLRFPVELLGTLFPRLYG